MGTTHETNGASQRKKEGNECLPRIFFLYKGDTVPQSADTAEVLFFSHGLYFCVLGFSVTVQ